MFQGYSDETFEFFMAIRFNNNRPFFQDNRDWYLRAVREPSIALAEELAATAEEIDPDLERRPYRVVSRINRDIRFARDKSPYRDHVWLSFHHTEGEKGKLPDLFFEVNDNHAFYGMGFYKSNRHLMDALRQRILACPAQVLELVEPLAQDFLFYGDINPRIAVPQEVCEPLRPLYASKTFYFEREITDFDLIRSPELAQVLRSDFLRFKPLYRYLKDLALQDEAPVRNQP